MRQPAVLCAVVLLASSFHVPAEEPAAARSPNEDAPHSALEALQGYVQRNSPPLQISDASRGAIVFSAAGLASVGCAGLALIPTFERWGPEEDAGEYFTTSGALGALQGMVLSTLIGIGLTDLLFPQPDIRAEYGRLLDTDQPDQERRAYLVLRSMARRARQRRTAAPLLMIAAAAIPAGAYYLGSVLSGPNPNAREVGIGYVLGVTLGSLYFPLLGYHGKTPEETLFEQVDRGDRPGGQP